MITTDKFGVNETPFEPPVLLVEPYARVCRASVVQCDQLRSQFEGNQTALMTLGGKIFKRVDRVREVRIIRKHEHKAGQLATAERVGRQDARGEGPIDPSRFHVLEEPRGGLPAETDSLVAQEVSKFDEPRRPFVSLSCIDVRYLLNRLALIHRRHSVRECATAVRGVRSQTLLVFVVKEFDEIEYRAAFPSHYA